MPIYYFIISFANLLFNTGFSALFIKFYSKNEDLDKEKRYNVFGCYIHFMCYIQTLGMIFAINSINFYRKSHRNNFVFWIFMIILIFFIAFIFCIFGYSIHPILSNHLAFEYNPKNVDTFDDKNKLISFSIFIGNVIGFYLFVLLMHFLFSKKADSDYQKKNKIVINKKEE